MIQRRQYLIPLAALVICAGCCHARNLSHWGHTPQTAVPVDSSTIYLPPAPPLDVPPPCNPAYFASPSGDALFSTDGDHSSASGSSHFHDDLAEVWPNIKQDYRNYYSWENFGMLVAGFSVGAVFANTNIDTVLRDEYQNHVRSSGTDNFAKVCKDFGTGGYMFPAMAAGWLTGELFQNSPCAGAIGEWGERSLRSAFVGGPPMLLMQYVTGGARPGESSAGSDWRPFASSHGVSGHAFVGGLVFIDAAKMADDPWLKGGFYALSVLPAWSRINDDAHYTSQALLGWWMAYCAATAVDITERGSSDWQVVPLPLADGVGMAVMHQY